MSASLIYEETFIKNLTSTLDAAITLKSDLRGMWLLICGIFFFMSQIGSAFYKAGSSSCTMVLSGAASTIIETVLTAIIWYLIGFGIAFSEGSIVGTRPEDYSKTNSEGYPLLFATCMIVTTAYSPIAGVSVGRLRLIPYGIIVILFSGIIFPIAAHWVWGADGFLAIWSNDKVGGGVLAASSPVLLFLLPSTFALCLSRYVQLGCFSAMPKIGHNRFFETVGLIFMWMGQYCLHMCGIGYSQSGQTPFSVNAVSAVALFSTICCSFAVLTTFVVSRELLGYFTLESVISCTISGLVMSCGSGFYIPLAYAPLMGVAATVCYYCSIYILETKLGVHDPLDGVANYFMSSLVSTLMTPLLADLSQLKFVPFKDGSIMETPSRGEIFSSHLLAIVCIIAWGVFCSFAVIILLCQLSKVIPVITSSTDQDHSDHGATHCDYTNWLVAPLVASKEAFKAFKEHSVISTLREIKMGTYAVETDELVDTESLATEFIDVKSASELIRIPADIAARFASTLIPGVNMTRMFQCDKDVLIDRKESASSLVTDPAFKSHSFVTYSNLSSRSLLEFLKNINRSGFMMVLRLFTYFALLTSITVVTAAVDGNSGSTNSIANSNITQEEVEDLLFTLQTELASVSTDLDGTWSLTCGIIVFSMQLGFCFLEAGSVRSGNVINIIFKNLGDCAIGSLMWWCVGYSIAYGSGSVFIGGGDEHLYALRPDADDPNASKYSHFFLSFTYMTAAVTIVSGAVAERMSLLSYYIFVTLATGFVYPTIVHWVWSDYGWLSPFSDNRYAANGVLDFAGSVVIHCYGGASALVLAFMLGNRVLPDGIDLFSEEGQLLVAPHNRFQQATGTLLLWFAWFAFNAGSVGGITNGGSQTAGLAAVNTILSSSAATVSGLVFSHRLYGYFDIGFLCNSALCGMVSITAGCAYISPPYSIVVGVVSTAVYYGIHKLRFHLRIDDVVDAGAVHLGGGMWGGISTGLFCDSTRIKVATNNSNLGQSYGLLTGSDHGQFVVQGIGVLSAICWAIITTVSIGLFLKYTLGLRVREIDELRGLDRSEHNAFSYDYVEKLEAERERAASSISLVENVSELLLKFDLDATQAYIDRSIVAGQQADQLASMRTSLGTIISNLRLFKPFLPNSIFSFIDGDQGDSPDAITGPTLPIATGTFTSYSKSQTSGYEKLLDIQRAIGLGVRKRRIVVAECHIPIRNTEDAYKLTTRLVSTLEAALESLNDKTLSACHNGIVQSISCGSAVITWQGPRAHRLAARFADDLIEERSICVGLSAGVAVTGNVGTTSLKSNFCAGEPLERANIFSRLAGALKCRVLCCRTLAVKFEMFAAVRPVDRIHGSAFDPNGSDVFSFEGILGVKTEDWMYDQVKDDPFPLYKSAWRFLLSRNFDRALDDINNHLVTQPDDRQSLLIQSYAKQCYVPVRISRSLPFSGCCEDLYATPHAAVVAALVALSSGIKVNIFMFSPASNSNNRRRPSRDAEKLCSPQP